MIFSLFCILWVLGVFATADTPFGKQKFPVLRGVNRSGTEYACIRGTGILDSPEDDAIVEATIQNMLKWNINVVRVPLNEDCWLGTNTNTKELEKFTGQNYRNKIIDFVKRLRSHKLYVILELHWSQGLYKGPGSACYEQAAKCQKPMPDLEYAPQFWKSVAETFKSDEAIIFDLFNEPFPDSIITNWDAAWKCWKEGGDSCQGFEYKIAGMQHLVKAVRDTGATNLIMLGGLRYANELEGWSDYVPYDPQNNLAASMHSYNFNACIDKACWDKGIGNIYKNYPVIVGEIGENTCTHDYIDQIMPYLDEKSISYLGWTWNAWDCKTGPSLVSSDNGEATPFGIGFKNHIAGKENVKAP